MCLALTLACASVPPAAVELSRATGAGIETARASQRAALDAFFSEKRARIDDFIERTYAPQFVVKALDARRRADLSANPSPDEWAQLIVRVVKTRDEMVADLELAHASVLRASDAHYDALRAANAETTALLASIVELDAARVELVTEAAGAAAVGVDFDALGKRLDAYLAGAGDVAGAATGLYEALRPSLGVGTEEELK